MRSKELTYDEDLQGWIAFFSFANKQKQKGIHMNKTEFEMLIKNAKDKITEVLQERNKEYGSFFDIADFTDRFFIANMKYTTDMLASVDIKDFKATKVAVFMLGLKLARIEKDYNNPHLDSIVDFLGYLHLLKQSSMKGFKLCSLCGTSKLHRQLIDFANKELENEC